MKKNCDLNVLLNVFSKEKVTPHESWALDTSYPENKGAAHVFVIGCPDGQGSYLQCCFDEDGGLLRAEIIDREGRTCSCKYCLPTKRKRAKE